MDLIKHIEALAGAEVARQVQAEFGGTSVYVPLGASDLDARAARRADRVPPKPADGASELLTLHTLLAIRAANPELYDYRRALLHLLPYIEADDSTWIALGFYLFDLLDGCASRKRSAAADSEALMSPDAPNSANQTRKPSRDAGSGPACAREAARPFLHNAQAHGPSSPACVAAMFFCSPACSPRFVTDEVTTNDHTKENSARHA